MQGVTLSGENWYDFGSTATVIAPAIWVDQTALKQYRFKGWTNIGTRTPYIANWDSPQTTVTINPSSYQLRADYTEIPPEEVEETVQIQVYVTSKLYQPPMIPNANVIVQDDAGAIMWRGKTDTQGLTSAITLRKNYIFTVTASAQNMTAKKDFKSGVDASPWQLELTQAKPSIIPAISIADLMILLLIIPALLLLFSGWALTRKRRKREKASKRLWGYF